MISDTMMMQRHHEMQTLMNIRWGVIEVDEKGNKIKTITTWSKRR